MYLEYHELLKKFKNAERNYNEALEKRSQLLLAVMPGAIKPKEVVATSKASPDANLIDYTSEIDEVDRLINKSRNTRDMLNYELKKKLIKMREEGDVYDKIYIYRWIEHQSVYKFYRLVGYSIRQIYNYIEEMKKNLYKS